MENETWDTVIRIYEERLPYHTFRMAKMLALSYLLKYQFQQCHVFTSHMSLNSYTKNRKHRIVIDSEYDNEKIDDFYHGVIAKNKVITLEPFYLSQALGVIKKSLEIINEDATE